MHCSATLELVSSTVGGTVRLHRQQQQPVEMEQEEQDARVDSRVQAWDEITAFQAGPNVCCMVGAVSLFVWDPLWVAQQACRRHGEMFVLAAGLQGD